MKILLSCLLALGFVSVVAQDSAAVVRPVTNVLALQLGGGKQRDTYLTPLTYSGSSIGVDYDRWRVMRSGTLTNQQLVSIDFMQGDDRHEHSEQWAGRLRYRYAMHWRVLVSSRNRRPSPRDWHLMVGPYAGADLGFNYNLKLSSSNNPATLRLAADVGASVMATTYYRIRRYAVPVQLQAQFSLLGAAFAPDYGESYYETFYLDNDRNHSHLTSLHNRHDFDIRLTTDVPLHALFRRFMARWDKTLRLGVAYHNEIMEVNDIQTFYGSTELIVGFVFWQVPFSTKRASLIRNDYAPAF